MSEHPLPARTAPLAPPAHARLGLFAIFGATFFELVGYFMLTPLLLLRLKDGVLETVLTGLSSPQGIAERNGVVFVAERGRNRILIVEPTP